eukprot:COSAG02_NODE_150_length_33596_cov_61.953966_26_plen_95_part_00
MRSETTLWTALNIRYSTLKPGTNALAYSRLNSFLQRTFGATHQISGSTAAVLLLRFYCCGSTAAVLLLRFYCSKWQIQFYHYSFIIAAIASAQR